jgi:hypothetical protein
VTASSVSFEGHQVAVGCEYVIAVLLEQKPVHGHPILELYRIAPPSREGSRDHEWKSAFTS